MGAVWTTASNERNSTDLSSGLGSVTPLCSPVVDNLSRGVRALKHCVDKALTNWRPLHTLQHYNTAHVNKGHPLTFL